MRKLLTILAADVANYSQYIEADEVMTLKHLAGLRKLMDPIIESHGGTIANTAGDSVLAYFDSPVEAVSAATKIQIAHSQYNMNSAPDTPLIFRIGINIGDVVIQPDGDILGHGVNVAARLEQLAEPGGICLSQGVMDQVSGKLQLEFSKVGEHRVKNLRQPIVVYSVGTSGSGLTKKLQRLTNGFISNPRAQFGFTIIAVISASLAIWMQRGEPVRTSYSNIPDFLSSDPTPEDIIQHFQPSTVGNFQGRNYIVLQTWGGEWDDIVAIGEKLGGYPVAINSQEENQFVYELTLKHPEHWQVLGKIHAGPTIGLIQAPGSTEPNGGWSWSNGESMTYENWKTYGPDNTGGKQSLARFGVRKDTGIGSTWNDVDTAQHAVVFEVPGNY